MVLVAWISFGGTSYAVTSRCSVVGVATIHLSVSTPFVVDVSSGMLYVPYSMVGISSAAVHVPYSPSWPAVFHEHTQN